MLASFISVVLMVAVVFLIVGIVTGNLFYVVKQQHAVIIERLGKFHRIVGAGFHARSRSWTARPPRSPCAR